MQQQGLGRVEQEILEYLRNNPGSSKADIIRHIRNKQLASRMTVLDYIKDLEVKNMIYGKKERPDSQSYMMYINEENKLASVLGELEEFKDAYSNLLEKSKEIINNRDYSADAKALGINETDPTKWSFKDKMRYYDLSWTKVEELWDKWEETEKKEKTLRQIHVKTEYPLTEERLNILVDRVFEILNEQLESLVSEGETGIEKLAESLGNTVQNTIDRKQILSVIRSCVVAVGGAEEEYSRYIQYIIDNVKGEGGILNLIYKIIGIFYVFTDIMFFRSTIKWPDIIQDRETLSQMYFVVHRMTIEIQLELSKFIRSINVLPMTETGTITEIAADLLPFGFIVSVRKYYSEFKLSETVWSFQALNMSSEIGRVLTSIMNLNKEIMEFGFLEIPRNKSELDITSSLEASHKRRGSITTLLKNVDTMLSSTTAIATGHELKKRHHNQDQQIAKQVAEKIQNAYSKEAEEELEEEGKRS